MSEQLLTEAPNQSVFNFIQYSMQEHEDRGTELISRLRAHTPEHPVISPETGLAYRNLEIAQLARSEYTIQELTELSGTLKDRGTLNIPITYGVITINGESRTIPMVAATETNANHGDMSSMIYLRDQIQTARALLELFNQEPTIYHQEGVLGRELLLSSLHLISTPSQLGRFNRVIALGKEATQKDWPHISILLNDLMGENPNGWRNIQDSFQMLGHLTLETLERGTINVDDLHDNHKTFLGSICPFLKSVGYPNYPNSGSWEEFTAPRTSVMAVEVSFMYKMKTLLESDEAGMYNFLKDIRLGTPDSFMTELNEMIHNGLVEIGARLPFETPDADPSTIDYREADAALVYVLMYNLPRILAEARIPIGTNKQILNEEEIENLVLAQLDSLIDEEIGGMRRYNGDSYEGMNFYDPTTQARIAAIKKYIQEKADQDETQPDLQEKQRLRGEAVERGREAAWSHPLGQLAAWAAKRSLQASTREREQHYRHLSTKYFNQALQLITGTNEWTIARQEDGDYDLETVPAYKLPECYIAYRDEVGGCVVPSPHTPLNWSTASLFEGLGLLTLATKKSRNHAASSTFSLIQAAH